MAVVLAVVLVSLSACVMPKTSRKDLGYTPSYPTKKGDRVGRKAVPDQCLDQALGTSCRSRGRPSFRSYAGQVGGGIKGEPVVRESVRGLGRSGRVLARRGGATGEGGLNDSVARGAVGRGRGGTIPFHHFSMYLYISLTPYGAKGRPLANMCPVRKLTS